MKKLSVAFLFSLFSVLLYAQDTTMLSSPVYLHIDNDMGRIFGSEELRGTDFSAENGSFSAYGGKLFFRPEYAGECWIRKAEIVYRIEVADLPAPEFYFAEHIGADTLTQEQVFTGLRLVPVWPDLPEDFAVRMGGIYWALYDEKRNELFAAEHRTNYVKTDVLYKKAAWLALKEVRVELPDGTTRIVSPAKTFALRGK